MQTQTHSWGDVRLTRTTIPARQTALHEAPGLSALLVLGGAAALDWTDDDGDQTLRVRPGSLLAIPQRMLHRSALASPLRVASVSVTGALAERLDAERPAGGARLGVYDPHAEAAIRALLSEMHDGAGGSLLAEAAATTALLRLFGRTETRTSALSPRELACVIDAIEARLGDDLTVEALADVVGVSPAHFSRRFAATTGDPPYRFVQRRRLDRAADLLRSTRLGVRAVAVRVGYTDPSAFGAAFRRRFGASPTAYRSAHVR